MGTAISVEEIKTKRHQLAELMREYTRSQLGLWQQIPWLALQADGRDGFADEASRNYRWGLMSLASGASNGYYNYFVDLETGVVIKNPQLLAPLSDDELLRLPLHELDAAAIVDRLMEACQETSDRSSNIAKSVNWRDELAAQYGLAADQPYKRIVPIKVDWDLD